MLILLPPSETKASGGNGAPLALSALSFPSLNAIRREIIADLCSLNVDESLEVLSISDALRVEAEANRTLRTSPTMPAVMRYTGVLYDALDAKTLTDIDPHALSRLAIGSALFGVIRAEDPIPRYRLSSGTKLPRRADSEAPAPKQSDNNFDNHGDYKGARESDAHRKSGGPVPTLQRRWGSHITEALTSTPDACGAGVIVDLRSGGYQNLGKIPASATSSGAVTVRVESVRADGTRTVVSHFNKHYKGILARVLATAGPQADAARSAADVAAIAEAAGLHIEITTNSANAASTNSLTLVV